MTGKVVPFGLPRIQAETLVKELSADSNNLVVEPKFSQCMVERQIGMAQVLRVLRDGHMDQGPTRDDYGEWRCRMRKRVAGRRVHVVVAISGDRRTLYLITTY